MNSHQRRVARRKKEQEEKAKLPKPEAQVPVTEEIKTEEQSNGN